MVEAKRVVDTGDVVVVPGMDRTTAPEIWAWAKEAVVIPSTDLHLAAVAVTPGTGRMSATPVDMALLWAVGAAMAPQWVAGGVMVPR